MNSNKSSPIEFISIRNAEIVLSLISKEDFISILEKTKDNFIKFDRSGICAALACVSEYDEWINAEIIIFLLKFIDTKSPYYTPFSSYWYKFGVSEPRIELLNRAIEYIKSH